MKHTAADDRALKVIVHATTKCIGRESTEPVRIVAASAAPTPRSAHAAVRNELDGIGSRFTHWIRR